MSAVLRDEDSADVHAVRQAQMYEAIWSADPAYGTRLADVVDTVEHRIVPHMNREYPNGSVDVIDFGAGDGRFLREIYKVRPFSCGIGIDLHEPKYLRDRAQRPSWLMWFPQPLWVPVGGRCDYAISTDTLEHMPPEMVSAVLKNIASSAPHGFLRISTRQDIYGTERGLHLHETVEGPEWWLTQCRAAGIEPSSWRVYPGHAVEIWW